MAVGGNSKNGRQGSYVMIYKHILEERGGSCYSSVF